MFATQEQQKLEDKRIEQINHGESLIVTEDTRQGLINGKFPYPTRWLHDKYKINTDPSGFNLAKSLIRTSSDLAAPFNENDTTVAKPPGF
jgi:hypothetical protein